MSAGGGPPAAAGIRHVEGPRGRLRVSDGGSGGLPVLLVHGGAGALEHWSAQLGHLRRARRAVALDLPGMGGSGPPRDADWSVPAMAGAVLAAADALGLERFALVGHSYGGAVISACAAARPERIAALVYADCRGTPWIPTPDERRELDEGWRPGNFEPFTARWYEPLLANATPETRRRVLAALRATPREAFVASVERSVGFDPRPCVAAFPGPLLAIGAALLDGPDMAQRALPVRAFRVMDGVSHWLMMDRPEAFDRHLDELLADVG